MTRETYEDGAYVDYRYDNEGRLASTTDSETGITTTYYYDFTGRMMRYTQSGNGVSYSGGYSYDTKNNWGALQRESAPVFLLVCH